MEERPVVEEAPAVEELTFEEPMVEEPVAEEVPAAAQAEPALPAREGAIDPAEMRRRIEETRARLKAKAFDAMMSGEAALLARDSGDSPVPRDVDVDVSEDVAESIEEGLSQEDA